MNKGGVIIKEVAYHLSGGDVISLIVRDAARLIKGRQDVQWFLGKEKKRREFRRSDL